MTTVYVVQHGEKVREPGDPGLTALGREQAVLAAVRLRPLGLRAVYSSPLLRALDTAVVVAGASELPLKREPRVTERMNWDGRVPFARFAKEWERCTGDRDRAPAAGDSSRAAGARFLEFLDEREAESGGPIAVVCHGGVTVDLLRTLSGDEGVPETLLREGVPSGAITVIEDLRPVAIATVDHLAGLATEHRPGWTARGPLDGGLHGYFGSGN